MSSQPPIGDHLVIPRNDIYYANEPSTSSHLSWKATFLVSQGWLLIAGSTVPTLFNLKPSICKSWCWSLEHIIFLIAMGQLTNKYGIKNIFLVILFKNGIFEIAEIQEYNSI